MSSNKEFEILFEGLKNGEHQFEFKITDAFFEELTYSIIEGADVDVKFTLTKRETMLIGVFEMDGFVSTACDRCTDTLAIPVQVSHQLVYKFDNELSDNEDLINIPSNAHSFNIAEDIYELLTVALPNRVVHKDGECNQEMLKLIDKYVSSSENDDIKNDGDDDTDPRWDALKNMN